MSLPATRDLDAVFGALSDPTRRAIVAALAQGERTLSELAAPFTLSQTAVSKHVRVLEQAELVSVDKRGRTRYCQLQGAPMKAATDYLQRYEAFWVGQLNALGQYLERSNPP